MMDNDYSEEQYEYKTYSWSDIWMMVITKPSLQTYVEILKDAEATFTRARNWIFIAGFTLAVVATFGQITAIDRSENYELALSTQTLICSPLISGTISGLLFVLLPFTVLVGVTHFLAGLFGDEGGTFGQLSFAVAASLAPIIMIQMAVLLVAIILGMPSLALAVSGVLSMYAIFHVLLAVQAVYKLSFGSMLIPAAAVIFLVLYLGILTTSLAMVADPDYIDNFEQIFDDILNDVEAQ